MVRGPNTCVLDCGRKGFGTDRQRPYENSAVWRGTDAKPSTETVEMELGPVRTLLFAAGDPVPSRASSSQFPEDRAEWLAGMVFLRSLERSERSIPGVGRGLLRCPQRNANGPCLVVLCLYCAGPNFVLDGPQFNAWSTWH